MTTLRPDARLSPESLGDAMRALARAFSAVQLYLPNNQQRAQRLADARAAFAQLWQRGEWVDIDVRENAFLFDGDVVYQDADRGAEALPWLLYRDGIRRLSVAPGFEEQELEAFLSLVQGARAASNDNDDLVTLLWIADYQCLRYHYLDSYGTDAAARVVDAAPSAQPVGFALASIDATDDAATSSPFLSMSDFDGALYFLDAREISALQSELDSVYAEDPRKPVLDSVLDMFELPSADETRSEVFETLDRFVVELLTASEYPMVAYALRECAALVRKNELPPALSVKLGSIAHRLSEPSAMSQLLLAIDDSARTPAMALLEELFRELRPSALEPLVLWLGTAGASPARRRRASLTAPGRRESLGGITIARARERGRGVGCAQAREQTRKPRHRAGVNAHSPLRRRAHAPRSRQRTRQRGLAGCHAGAGARNRGCGP
jgi:hypothetical protein